MDGGDVDEDNKGALAVALHRTIKRKRGCICVPVSNLTVKCSMDSHCVSVVGGK